MPPTSDLAPRDATADDAFQREMLRWLPDVARYARALARDPADADDLVQETYLHAFRARHTFRPGSEARPWLCTICRHLFVRGRKRDARFVATDGSEAELEARGMAVDHAAAGSPAWARIETQVDVGPAIRAAIAALPDAFRGAVEAVDVDGLGYLEAAERLGVPVGTVRSRLFRARRQLQAALLAHGRDAGVAAEDTR